ncbi:hypothetical protein ACF05T_20270 [Streptomyces lateritius]|uniref:Uncharacterized protein n=1 Tax=Streptomyces lateritius TaxID=67313 RepID=A0ABW6YFW1_9ACTN
MVNDEVDTVGTAVLLAAAPAGRGRAVDATSVLPALAAVPPGALTGTPVATVVELADPLDPQTVLTRLRAAAATPGPLAVYLAGQLQLDRRQRLPHLALARSTPTTLRYTGLPWHWLAAELAVRRPGTTTVVADLVADAEAWEWLASAPGLVSLGPGPLLYGRVAPAARRGGPATPEYLRAFASIWRTGARPPTALLHAEAAAQAGVDGVLLLSPDDGSVGRTPPAWSPTTAAGIAPLQTGSGSGVPAPAVAGPAVAWGADAPNSEAPALPSGFPAPTGTAALAAPFGAVAPPAPAVPRPAEGAPAPGAAPVRVPVAASEPPRGEDGTGAVVAASGPAPAADGRSGGPSGVVVNPPSAGAERTAGQGASTVPLPEPGYDPHPAILAAARDGRHAEAVAVAVAWEQEALRRYGARSQEAVHWMEVRADLARLAGEPARSCELWLTAAQARLGLSQEPGDPDVEGAVDRAHHQWEQIKDPVRARELGPALVELRQRVPGRRAGALAALRRRMP